MKKMALIRQIKFMERELSKKQYFNPKMVAKGKLKKEDSHMELIMMQEVLNTLIGLYERRSETNGDQLSFGLHVNSNKKHWG